MNGGRVLCVGKNAALLSTRSAVLTSSGYEASSVLFPAAGAMLSRGRFDLVVLCRTLNQIEQQRILALVPGETQILALRSLTMPNELLARVEQLLRNRRDSYP